MVGILLLLATTCLMGCGGGGSPPDTTGSNPSQSFDEKRTEEFVLPNENNDIQYFGHEGTDEEREDASAVVSSWMRARSAKDFRRECAYLAQPTLADLRERVRFEFETEATSCREALNLLGAIASGDYVNTMTGPIDSLRVGNGEAFAQYHGNDGEDWFVPLQEEQGRWKVAITAPLKRIQH